MHILLTDRLTCPRCGPEFGLILLAEHIQDRRVLEGELGCPNCRERFSVQRGIGDLRWSADDAPSTPESQAPTDRDDSGDPESAMRVAGLLGIPAGPGHVLLVGSTGRYAPFLADLVDGIEWVTTGESGRDVPERTGVSRVWAYEERLPFFSGMFRGAVTTGGAEITEIERVLNRTATLVVLDPADAARGRIREAGFDVVMDDPVAVVARAR